MTRWEIAVTLERSKGVLLFRQIARAITDDIRRGRLRPGDVPPGALFFAPNRPDVRLIPHDLIGRAYRRVIRRGGGVLLSYAAARWGSCSWPAR